MLALGILVATVMTAFKAKRHGQELGRFLSVGGTAVFNAILGGYALFIIVNGLNGEWRLFPMGLVFYGAYAAAVVTVIVMTRFAGIPKFKFGDLTIVGMLTAQGIGRIGCYLGGCCYGSASDGPFAVHFPAGSNAGTIGRHPTQLYSSVFLFLLAFAISRMPEKEIGTGRRFFTYLFAYSAGRFLLEFFRGDEVRGIFSFGLSTSQVIALVVMGCVPFAWKRYVPQRRVEAV